jgi:hypothetical protein
MEASPEVLLAVYANVIGGTLSVGPSGQRRAMHAFAWELFDNEVRPAHTRQRARGVDSCVAATLSNPTPPFAYHAGQVRNGVPGFPGQRCSSATGPQFNESNLNGFWLIRPDGSRSPAFTYLQAGGMKRVHVCCCCCPGHFRLP